MHVVVGKSHYPRIVKRVGFDGYHYAVVVYEADGSDPIRVPISSLRWAYRQP